MRFHRWQKRFSVPALAAVVVVCSCRSKTRTGSPQHRSRRINAVGKTNGLSRTLRRAFDPSDHFAPMGKARPGDWLDRHKETGQTFDQFVSARFNRPDKTRKNIVLQPLGAFAEGKSPDLEKLKQYAAAYFGMNVTVRPVMDPAAARFTSRKNPYTKNRQILAGDVLSHLKKHLPASAFAMLGVTMIDLYPDPTWNFVFGMASLRERVGVFSFVRYDPAFYGERRSKGYRTLLLKRSLKVLAHETGHMFGMQHCIFYNCLMNGSNHLQESDGRPPHLCPVCLRKLHHAVGFDVVKRYRELERLYRAFGMPKEADWVARRAGFIEGK